MNAYDSDRLNEAETRAETAEEELKVCQERLKDADERFDELYDNYRALAAREAKLRWALERAPTTHYCEARRCPEETLKTECDCWQAIRKAALEGK